MTASEDKAVHTLSDTFVDQRLHLLIPATHGDLNLCKTLLGAAMLDYPTPTLTAWDRQVEDSAGTWMMAGGTHMVKIGAALEHLNAMEPDQDNDLAMMIDAYDVWFQLPRSVLLERYRMVNAYADMRIVKQLGRTAVRKENISQSIIFAAGKRCAPNQIHTIACYPIPASPLPDDLYYGNTDTDIGLNEYFSHRQRWLNSGLIIGPVKKMRKMLTYAAEILANGSANDPEDNGSHGSDNFYHGSDQSVFAKIWGEQEFQREVIRRQYEEKRKPLIDHWLNKVGTIFTSTSFEGGDDDEFNDKYPSKSSKRLHRRGGGTIDPGIKPYDPLNPPFTHEHIDSMPDHPREFGIGVDHFSDLSHQTINSEGDARWLVHNNSLDDQITDRTRFDCKWRLPDDLPSDLLSEPSARVLKEVVLGGGGDSSDAVSEVVQWQDQSLYTHLCLGTVPVMIHHNGDKGAREHSWHKLWWQPHARKAMDLNWRGAADVESELNALSWAEHLRAPSAGKGAAWGGAWDKGKEQFMDFSELCQKDYERDLVRDGPNRKSRLA